MASSRVEVAAAVILREDGSFLLGQRPTGKVYAGYWEFPGGKIEPGEHPLGALDRELHEELGIRVTTAYPWLTRDYDYEHAAVRLRFFRVAGWSGVPKGRERQQFAWARPGAVDVAPMLPANGPILRALALPPVYGITNAAEAGRDVFMRRLASALEHGLQLLQVREPGLAPDALADLAREVFVPARAHGARVLVNGDPATALRAGADGVHLSARRLMALAGRPALDLVAASCHDARELARAVAIGADFAVLGPVQPTPSHPGAPTLGWERFGELVRDCPLPVYALGGLVRGDLETAWRHGAHGIAMMRGAWR